MHRDWQYPEAVALKIVVFRYFAKFTGKQAYNFIKKETPIMVFSCEFCEILKKIEHLWRLLL